MKSIQLEKATPEAFDAVISFYDDVIKNTPGIELTARWRKGAHPTEEGLRNLLEEVATILFVIMPSLFVILKNRLIFALGNK